MAVLILHSLNDIQKEDIQKLITICNEYDELKRQPDLKEEDNYNAKLNSFYCYYEQNKLLSVLIIFQPFESEAEITAYTLPSYRRQGYFKVLFHAACKELKKFGVSQIAFVVEYQSKDGKACAVDLGADMGRSDYLMAYNYKAKEKREDVGLMDDIIVTDLTNINRNEGIKTFQQIFNWDEEQIEELLNESLDSSDYHTYLAYIKGKAAGTLSIYQHNSSVSIFGFGIIKRYRGKGYGKSFLNHVLNIYKEEGKEKVLLQVESERQEAFLLYKKTGFDILEEYDYYYLDI